ncbi:ribonuclease inhibitor isoform X1 [Alligator sinensis]|uniref:Ribonuclease inhibitor n=2 Tax=Alligator sinensis TaxID=38654 RepID=A0A1U7RUH7_ALLSI|nr:ribonuclease inhibitor isoform X1 [Alligator sinensis]
MPLTTRGWVRECPFPASCHRAQPREHSLSRYSSSHQHSRGRGYANQGCALPSLGGAIAERGGAVQIEGVISLAKAPARQLGGRFGRWRRRSVAVRTSAGYPGLTSTLKMDPDIQCEELTGSRWTELVSSMKNSKSIRLDDCSLSRSHCEDLCSVLSTNQSLKELKLSNNELKDDGVEVLCKGLLTPSCNLELLWLQNCSLTGACCESLRSVLSKKPSLTELHLGDNKLETAGGKVLCKGLLDSNCKIRNLTLSYCELTKDNAELLTSVLCAKPTLKELNLSNNELGDAAIKQLCRGLMDSNCNLELLHLENCGVTAESCADLSNVLRTKPSLIDLAVGDNKFGDAGLALLCQGLLHPNCKVQKLWLWECDLTAASCKDLSNLIRTKESLIEMSLITNSLGDAGMDLLCQGLKDPKCKLQSLWLRECGLTSACCESIRSVLSTNMSLKELQIGSNKLEDEGVKLICEGLRQPSCNIESIWLGDSDATAGCCDSIAAVISTKQCLREIDLSNNMLEDAGVRKLYEAVKSPNCKLKHLVLYDIYWSSEVDDELQALEESKPGLKIIS